MLLGLVLFSISLIVRAAANTLVGHATAGPGETVSLVASPDIRIRLAKALLFFVVLPAVIETPIIVFLVRAAKAETLTVGLCVAILLVAGLAWLFHGASAGSTGQAAGFALLAFASWEWGRRAGYPSAIGLAIIAHAVWNTCAWLIYAGQLLE